MSALREIAAHFGVDFDTAPLQKGGAAVSSVTDSLMGMAKTFGVGLALGAVYHFTTGLFEQADALNKQSRAMGMSVQDLQAWNYAAGIGGASAETLTGVLQKLGGGKFDKGLAALGIATKDTAGKTKGAGDLLGDVADKLLEIKDPAERNRKAIDVLGKSYTKLLPMLEGGSKGLKELKQEFIDMGGGFDPEFAKNSEAFDDNMLRMKTIWKQLAIQVIGAVLPMILSLTNKLVTWSRTILPLITHSKLFETALAGLAIKGVAFLSGKMGPLGGSLKMLAGQFLKVVLPLLLLEDLLVFLAGGDSLLGRAIDKAFGKGKADDVRKWIDGVWKDFMSFINQIKTAPLSLVDDWNVLTTQLDKDIRGVFGDTFGEMLGIAGGMFVTFIDLLTGGWNNFGTKMGAIWDYIVLIGKIAWTELEGGFEHLAAIIGDAFITAWNAVIGGLNGVLMKVEAGLNKIGLMSDKEVADNKKIYAGQQGTADLAATVEKARDMNRTKLAGDYDSIQARLNGSAGASGGIGAAPTVNNTVNVTVPPGTPAQQAAAVAAAAKAGTNANNKKATQAATVPGGAGARGGN